MEFKVLRSRLGVSLLGAAVFDDILVLLCLAVFTALTQMETSGGFTNIIWILVRMVLFLGAASVVGKWSFPRLTHRIGHLPISQGLIAFAFVILLIFGWLAETIGQMAAITGAFLAGLWFNHTSERERIHNGIGAIAYGVFVPIFFINIGLSANVRELNRESGFFFLVLIVIAVISKVLGGGLGAILGGLTQREAVQIGVGMMSRGEVGLIVASIGVQNGLIDSSSFSAIVGVMILTTVFTPLMLRATFAKQKVNLPNQQKTNDGG